MPGAARAAPTIASVTSRLAKANLLCHFRHAATVVAWVHSARMCSFKALRNGIAFIEDMAIGFRNYGRRREFP
jgi:hypothetical protein